MKPLLSLVVIAAVAAGPAGAASRCVTPPQAEALTSVALPDIMREAGRVCATALPATALVRRTSGAWMAKYLAEADRAWPAARLALVQLSDPAIVPFLDSDFARPMLTALLVPQLMGRIDVADCPTIDRFATLLEPLPPRNTAGIVVTTLRYLKAQKARNNVAVQNVPDLPICGVK